MRRIISRSIQLQRVIPVALATILCIVGITDQSVTLAQQADSTPGAQPDVHFSMRAVGTEGTSYFEDVEINPGETVTLEVELVNWSAEPVDVRVYSTSAHNGINGGFVAGERDEQPAGPAAWIDLPTQEILLEGSSSQLVPFDVTVPDDVDPGQYISAIVVETADPLPIAGSENLEQTIRYAISVGILVPGEMTASFELGDPVLLEQSLEIPIRNTGNFLVRPVGELELRNSAGETVLVAPLELGSIYAGNETIIAVGLPVQLPDDDYSLTLVLTDPESGSSAGLDNAVVSVVNSGAESISAVSIVSATIEPNDEDVTFADVELVLLNDDRQMPVNVTLGVYRDGELVEDVVLATNQVILVGENSFATRYLPADMWEPGTYTFSLSVHAVDPETSQTTVLLEEELEAEIVVP